MKLTAGEVFQAYQAATALAKEKLPVKGAYWIGRIIRKLEPEYIVIETQRNELIRKHGTKQEDGSVSVLNEQIAAFSTEFGGVLSQEIEVDCPTVKLELLGDGVIAGGALVQLDRFIEV